MYDTYELIIKSLTGFAPLVTIDYKLTGLEQQKS